MSEDVIEVDEVMERVQDDRELLIELLNIFQEDYSQKRKQIDEVVQAKNFEELKNIAHSLKGASSNISAKRIFVSFAELEKIADQGMEEKISEVLSNIDSQYIELQTFIIKLKDDLK